MTDATAHAPAAIDVSIVAPVYNEIGNVDALVERIAAAMQGQPWRFELIAVDDGSEDGSGQRLCALADDTERRPWLRPVLLARNYGQSSALQAGFERVRGRYVVTLDADLQNEPGDIPLLLQQLDGDQSIDMVSGWRKDRQDAALSRRLPSRIANRLISRVTGVRLHDYGCALKAYRRHIIDRIHLYGELHRFIPSLARDAGARIAEVFLDMQGAGAYVERESFARMPFAISNEWGEWFWAVFLLEALLALLRRPGLRGRDRGGGVRAG